eukprot:1797285-Alexandrium_andersonii.AAC.1
MATAAGAAAGAAAPAPATGASSTAATRAAAAHRCFAAARNPGHAVRERSGRRARVNGDRSVGHRQCAAPPRPA